MYLFQIYHQLSKQKNKGSTVNKPLNEWSEEWKTTYVKHYERFPLLQLPDMSRGQSNELYSVLVDRRSGRSFGNTITKDILSKLLYFSVGETDKEYGDNIGLRVYSSGGGRYPLEFYIIFLKEVEGIPLGVYHYDLEGHGLRKIRNNSINGHTLAEAVGYQIAKNASFAIVFTGTFLRSSSKYGEKSYRFILLEAGGVMQNFSLMARSLSIDSVSIGGLAENVIEPLLDIDGAEESIVHMMLFG